MEEIYNKVNDRLGIYGALEFHGERITKACQVQPNGDLYPLKPPQGRLVLNGDICRFSYFMWKKAKTKSGRPQLWRQKTPVSSQEI